MRLYTIVAFFLASVLSGLFIWGNSLSTSLDRERAEKKSLLQKIAKRDSTIATLERTRNADNEAAINSLRQMELWHDLDTEVAQTITSLPTVDCERNEQQEQYGKQTPIVYNIDVPLPSLSAPLVLLYEKLSSTERPTNASSMVTGDKAFASSVSPTNVSKANGSMDKVLTTNGSYVQRKTRTN